ncbi:MAG: exodeoxyribonuclease VII large subunit [Bacteroidaceae bacterium]|nr:exodeoxyribonuclease VII large subunit [Bacteroidaceae bacterium]
MKTLTLFEFNSMVREVIETSFDHTFWVQGEIASCQVNATGHCYMELIQKAPDGGGVIARAKANIWRTNFQRLRPFFERETGQRLAAGLNILVEVSVTFHEAYGYSLVVQGIDPTYTMGDMARRRKEILMRLAAEGVIDLNRGLSMPVLPQRIAVISSATAAGYGDFCNQLENNQYGFKFYVRLFQAMMQGDRVEESVIDALDRIASQRDRFDVVVIIRGGGSSSELSCFDSYNLALNVANFPLPVITGIGHERDDTVIDAVSHTRVKTPTAAAELLISCLEDAAAGIDRLSKRLVEGVSSCMETAGHRLALLSQKLPSLFSVLKVRQEQYMQSLMERAASAARSRTAGQRYDCDRLSLRLENGMRSFLSAQSHRLELVAGRIEAASPERILRQGYTMTIVNGHVARSVAALHPGDSVTMRFADGSATGTIDNVESDK